MGFRASVLSVIVLNIFMVGCHANNAKKGDVKVIEQEMMNLMRRMDTLDERSKMTLLSKVDEQRNELLGVLLKHIGTSESKNVQAAAIYLIGRHRLSDGVQELIQRIDFTPGGQPTRGPEPLWEQYPAMEALITIGWSSVPAAVELLAKDTNDVRRDLAVKVIRYATDAEVAKFILERAHKIESDPTRKANLQNALVRLDKLPQ
ncbi:MAG: hypothetical protein JXA81_04060 [Sedimentisphaerales bacterium]|nr:hypothetical protein [Sedimentisphaerales bacterium]